ncbi:MAG: B-box zinc finger protein [Acidobacteriota bacterium]
MTTKLQQETTEELGYPCSHCNEPSVYFCHSCDATLCGQCADLDGDHDGDGWVALITCGGDSNRQCPAQEGV